jgi:3'-phosphoadenosine 5'-phosphosulfate (PAPS) 3'-phosphatase
LDREVYLFSIYAKNEQSNMTAADRKAAKKFVEALKDAKKQAGK